MLHYWKNFHGLWIIGYNPYPWFFFKSLSLLGGWNACVGSTLWHQKVVVFDPWVLLTTHTFYPSTYMYIISCLFITRLFLYNSLLFLNRAELRYSSLFLILRELRYFSIFTYLGYCQQADFIYWDLSVATTTSSCRHNDVTTTSSWRRPEVDMTSTWSRHDVIVPF